MNTSTFCELGEPAQDHLACIGPPPRFAPRIGFPIATPSRTEKPPPAKGIVALMLRQLYYDVEVVWTDREAAGGKKQ